MQMSTSEGLSLFSRARLKLISAKTFFSIL